MLLAVIVLVASSCQVQVSASYVEAHRDIKHIQTTLKEIIATVPPLNSYGLFDGIADKINGTVNQIADTFKDKPVTIEHLSLVPGTLEFGDLNLQLYDVELSGIETIVAEVIEFTLIPTTLKNMTLHFSKLQLACKKYTMDGIMLFPMGNQIIPLSGTGAMSLTATDLYVSLNATIGIDTTGERKIAIKKLEMFMWAQDMGLYFENFMNDDELSWAFNQVFADVGITAFNYYKDAMLQGLNEPMKQLIDYLIQQLL